MKLVMAHEGGIPRNMVGTRGVCCSHSLSPTSLESPPLQSFGAFSFDCWQERYRLSKLQLSRVILGHSMPCCISTFKLQE
jgi:hypothetical protein